jgi:hypothetical protein
MLSSFSFFTSNIKNIAVKIEDIKSDIGAAIHTPFNLKILGRISSIGIKIITCLKSAKNIDIFAFPIA